MYSAYFESQKTGGNIKYLAEQRDLQTGKLLDDSSRILSAGPGGLSMSRRDWWPFQYNPNSYLHIYAVLRIDQVIYDVLFSGTANCS